MLILGVLIDLSETTIRRLLFDHDYLAPITIAKFVYRLGKVRDLVVMRYVAQKASLLRWIANHIVDQDTDAD